LTGLTHPPFPARRTGSRASTWWGRAWVRAVEEAAYDESELRAGRALARTGQIGGLTVDGGSVVAAVRDRDDVHSVQVRVPLLEDRDVDAFVEVVAAAAGRIAALLAGDLPHELVEHAEEAGVELLPYGGELEATCTCAAWVQPCAHALAVLTQLAWLLDADPLVLLRLRGLPRDVLLARLHARTVDAAPEPPDDPDVDSAADAALRAARVLDLLETTGDIEHLL
jgi:uncharacterized Zn finger protein